MGECTACRTLERVRALTRILQGAAPATAILKTAGDTNRTFGPFHNGAIVRIKTGFCGDDTAVPPVPFGVFYRFGGSDVLAASTGEQSYPLGSFQWEDVEITQDWTYINVALDGFSSSAVVLCEITDIIRKDRQSSGYGP